MTTRIAITGFGRIGRLTLRAIAETGRKDIEIVGVNIGGDIETAAHLLEYDTIHGRFPAPVKVTQSSMDIGLHTGAFEIFSERDPSKLAWGKLGVDVVMECTGAFNSKNAAMAHIDAGAKQVLISAPAKDADATIVYGVNDNTLTKAHKIVSNASCTTNALAPLAAVLDENFGIVNGHMTTIHAFTSDQRLMDNRHKDLRRARSAVGSMIPTSTGAAKALGLVLPQLAGRLGGTAIRVPTANVSMIDLVFTPEKKTSADSINAAMLKAAQGKYKDIIGYENAPLVSTDFNHQPHSAIFDATGTQITADALVRVMAWYDNEWGYSLRMADTAVAMAKAQ